MEEMKFPDGFLLLPGKEEENYDYTGQTCVGYRAVLSVNSKVLAVEGCRGALCENRPGAAPCQTQPVPAGSNGPNAGHG